MKEDGVEARLLEYEYESDCQGTVDRVRTFALVYVDEGASTRTAALKLMEKFNAADHKIIMDSIVDKTAY